MLFILVVAGLMGWGFWQFHHSGKMSEKRAREQDARDINPENQAETNS